jgi:uncharacterized protein YyaL (SSP411 family)
MIRVVRDTYNSSVTLHCRQDFLAADPLDTLAPFTRTMTARDRKATAYVCCGRTCSDPVTTPDALRELLNEKSKPEN